MNNNIVMVEGVRDFFVDMANEHFAPYIRQNNLVHHLEDELYSRMLHFSIDAKGLPSLYLNTPEETQTEVVEAEIDRLYEEYYAIIEEINKRTKSQESGKTLL